VARAVAFVPDLLFGSNVFGALQAGGHEAVLASNENDLRAALAAAPDVLIVDLTAEPAARIELVREALGSAPRPRTLAFYAHVERDVRAQAEASGFDLVVPRSRMARVAAELVSELSGEESSG
jgi:DNA-binding NarL/FixJ family response regulator